MNETHPTFHILTWGCQMNEDDTEQIALFMEQAGFLAANSADDADVVLLNTCSVRRKPEDKAYSKLGELAEIKRHRSRMVIAVCGCMAQAEGAEIARRAPFVDLIVGPGRAADLPALVGALLNGNDGGGNSARARAPRMLLDSEAGEPNTVPLRAVGRPSRLRAFVPVMYGCDRFCTFCIVPLTRGRERSRPLEEIVAEVRSLAATGTREVTLLGQTVNYYGRRLPGRPSFADLLRAVSAVPGIARVRFTSPHPRGFTQEVIDAMAALPQVCEHVHLPLQAADNHLLKRMKRGYTIEQYDDVLQKLRAAMPGVSVTTDLMVGFPGETEAEFEATMDYVRHALFDAAFMFAHSPRQGTKAAAMGDQLDRATKVRRLSALIELQNRITTEINARLVGSVQEVLIDGRSARDEMRLSGLTRTFKTTHVELPNGHTGEPVPRAGDIVEVVITHAGLTGLVGRMAVLPETRQLQRTKGSRMAACAAD